MDRLRRGPSASPAPEQTRRIVTWMRGQALCVSCSCALRPRTRSPRPARNRRTGPPRPAASHALGSCRLVVRNSSPAVERRIASASLLSWLPCFCACASVLGCEQSLYDFKGGSLRSPPAPAAGGRKRPSSPDAPHRSAVRKPVADPRDRGGPDAASLSHQPGSDYMPPPPILPPPDPAFESLARFQSAARRSALCSSRAARRDARSARRLSRAASARRREEPSLRRSNIRATPAGAMHATLRRAPRRHKRHARSCAHITSRHHATATALGRHGGVAPPREPVQATAARLAALGPDGLPLTAPRGSADGLGMTRLRRLVRTTGPPDVHTTHTGPEWPADRRRRRTQDRRSSAGGTRQPHDRAGARMHRT